MSSLGALCTRAPSNNWLSLDRPPRAAAASSSTTALPYRTRVQTHRDISIVGQTLSVQSSASLWHQLAVHGVAQWDCVWDWFPEVWGSSLTSRGERQRATASALLALCLRFACAWLSLGDLLQRRRGLLLAQRRLFSAICMDQPTMLRCMDQPTMLRCIAFAYARLAPLSLFCRQL